MAERTGARRWGIALLGIALVAGHALALGHAWSKVTLPAAALGGVALVVVVKHLGIAGALLARWRRPPRP